MFPILLKRFGSSLIVIFVTLTLIFLGLAAAPGDELDTLLTPEAASAMTEADFALLRAEMGLDRPVLIRYAIWMKNTLSGDLGYSTSEDGKITEILKSYVGHTLILIAAALLIGIILGLAFGILAALKENTWVDYLVGSVPIFIAGVPGFILSLFFIYTVAVKLDLLPAGGMHTLGDESLGDLLKHMVLPVTVLGLVLAAQLVRYTRASMLDVLSSEFIIAAKSKGISNRRVIFNHGFKAALVPIISVIGLHIPEIIAGAVITETVFQWEGMGVLAVRAASGRDVPMVMGIVIVVSIAVVISNFITDVAYTIADPRVRLG